MAELKQYNITTDTGYQTTLQFSDEDAKVRGLLGKDTETVAAAEAKAQEEAEAKAKADAQAEAEAKAKADAEAQSEAEAKQAGAQQNKQAKPASTR